MINEPFGWMLVAAGFVSGAALGTRFLRDDWLGGYGAPRRRLVRLGHIAMVALGILNILFAGSAERVRLADPWLAAASWGFVVGGITMPLVCGLTAWRRGLKPLFVVPVLALLGGAVLVTVGLLVA